MKNYPAPRQPRLPARRWWITAAALSAVIGLAGCATTSSTPATSPSTPAQHGMPGGGAGGGSNARSGPASGGSLGTIGTVSTTGFTLSTPAGQQVTVTEDASTTYLNGTSSTSASAVTTGESVLVLGMTTGTTIAATQVMLQPAIGSRPAYTPSPAVPFTQGAPSAAQQDGQIPANYSQGSGTIVSGTTADQATLAALAAYPGGVVDRVVQLSSGEYEVHYIGVNWPHHIFVNMDFTVAGAN